MYNRVMTIEDGLVRIQEYKNFREDFLPSLSDPDPSICILDEIINPFQIYKENKEMKNILDDIEKYIYSFNIKNMDKKLMLILNDILLIKLGRGKEVKRLNDAESVVKDVRTATAAIDERMREILNAK